MSDSVLCFADDSSDSEPLGLHSALLMLANIHGASTSTVETLTQELKGRRISEEAYTAAKRIAEVYSSSFEFANGAVSSDPSEIGRFIRYNDGRVKPRELQGMSLGELLPNVQETHVKMLLMTGSMRGEHFSHEVGRNGHVKKSNLVMKKGKATTTPYDLTTGLEDEPLDLRAFFSFVNLKPQVLPPKTTASQQPWGDTEADLFAVLNVAVLRAKSERDIWENKINVKDAKPGTPAFIRKAHATFNPVAFSKNASNAIAARNRAVDVGDKRMELPSDVFAAVYDKACGSSFSAQDAYKITNYLRALRSDDEDATKFGNSLYLSKRVPSHPAEVLMKQIPVLCKYGLFSADGDGHASVVSTASTKWIAVGIQSHLGSIDTKDTLLYDLNGGSDTQAIIRADYIDTLKADVEGGRDCLYTDTRETNPAAIKKLFQECGFIDGKKLKTAKGENGVPITAMTDSLCRWNLERKAGVRISVKKVCFQDMTPAHTQILEECLTGWRIGYVSAMGRSHNGEVTMALEADTEANLDDNVAFFKHEWKEAGNTAIASSMIRTQAMFLGSLISSRNYLVGKDGTVPSLCRPWVVSKDAKSYAYDEKLPMSVDLVTRKTLAFSEKALVNFARPSVTQDVMATIERTVNESAVNRPQKERPKRPKAPLPRAPDAGEPVKPPEGREVPVNPPASGGNTPRKRPDPEGKRPPATRPPADVIRPTGSALPANDADMNFGQFDERDNAVQ